MKALIFDCDGVLVDTERDGHRVAFNRAFASKGYPFAWSVAEYKELLRVAGGKERMRYYFNQTSWPVDMSDKESFIKELHCLKTDIFMEIIAKGELSLRSGVIRLVDEAIAADIVLAVCSTSNERAVNLIVKTLLGTERKSNFKAILAGDVVSHKKPHPEIYLLALDTLQLQAQDCVVVEDSRNGLLAAKTAGMKCVITTNGYTEDENFQEANMVVTELGDPPDVKVTLKELMKL
jgi:HAD superfamily hydrolase (TIGR01509 family)